MGVAREIKIVDQFVIKASSKPSAFFEEKMLYRSAEKKNSKTFIMKRYLAVFMVRALGSMFREKCTLPVIPTLTLDLLTSFTHARV